MLITNCSHFYINFLWQVSRTNLILLSSSIFSLSSYRDVILVSKSNSNKRRTPVKTLHSFWLQEEISFLGFKLCSISIKTTIIMRQDSVFFLSSFFFWGWTHSEWSHVVTWMAGQPAIWMRASSSLALAW